MADIQLILCKNQQNLNHGKIVPYKEIRVKESNDDVKLLTGSS